MVKEGHVRRVMGVIPARYESTRFPGKPLADICGRPMVWWVYRACEQASLLDGVLVATDDERIAGACREWGMRFEMTSPDNRTGTDRVAEVAERVEADLWVNVQGDEPLIEPGVIDEVVRVWEAHPGCEVANLMARVTDPVDAVNPTVPKVIASEGGRAVYLTRALAPFPKGAVGYGIYKQVCAYAFSPAALRFFRGYERERGKAPVEAIEDIEILRFIECGWEVRFGEVGTASVAVDTPKDLERVRRLAEAGGGLAIRE